MYPFYAEDRVVCVPFLCVENSLESPFPVDKPHGGNRLGRGRKPQERLSVVKGYKGEGTRELRDR